MTRGIKVFVDDKLEGEVYQSEFMSDGKVMDAAKIYVPNDKRPYIESTSYIGGKEIRFRIKKNKK